MKNPSIQTSDKKAPINSRLAIRMHAQRRAANVYTPQGRSDLIRRMLQMSTARDRRGDQRKGVSIEMYNGEPYMVNPPYGYIPFAMTANKDDLEKAINYCGMKKKQYEQSGDWNRMWLFAQRQSMLAGVLNHLVRFKYVNQ